MNFNRLLFFAMAVLLVLLLVAGPSQAAENYIDRVKKTGKDVEGKLKEVKESIESE